MFGETKQRVTGLEHDVAQLRADNKFLRRQLVVMQEQIGALVASLNGRVVHVPEHYEIRLPEKGE